MLTRGSEPLIDPTDPVALAVHALDLDEAYQSSGQLELGEQAAEYFRASVAAAPADHPGRALFLSGAAMCFQRLFDRTGRTALAEEAEQLGRDALAITSPDDRFYAQCLTIIGTALTARYERTGQVEVLREAVAMYRAAVDVAPEDPVDRAAGLTNFGNALQRLFKCTGDMALLSEAVEANRNAVAVTPADHPDRARWQTNLAVTLRTYFERSGDLTLLREAVEAGRAAVQVTSEDRAERALQLGVLASALYRWSEHTGDVDMLNEALGLARNAVATMPEDHPRRASALSDFGAIARLLFEYTGETGVLAEAVEAGRAAVAAVPIGRPERLDHLNNLGIASRQAYERTGDQELLVEAVRAGRESVEGTPVGHPARVVRVTNLVSSLQRQFEITGRSDALLEAVAEARVAVQAMPHDLADRGAVLGALGDVLRAAYERTRLPGLLGEAAQMLRDAVEATPVGHPRRPGRLNDLAGALILLAEHTGMRDGFAAANFFLEQAEAATPADHPQRLVILGNRAATALKIFEFDKRPEIGEAAVAALRAVAHNTPETHPDRATRLRSLGLALQTLAAESEAGARLLEESRECFKEAANFAAAPTLVRIRAGREQARLELAAADAPEAALDAIEQVVDLIDLAAPVSLIRRDREYQMALLDGLPAQAAAAALAAGRPERAVELLERSRGVLVAETLGLRGGELTRLRAAHPELARRFDQAREALAALDQNPEMASVVGERSLASEASAVRAAERRVEARAVVEGVLSRVRTLPGFGDFLRPSLPMLTESAQAGPIVLVNCDPARCDALVLTGDPTEPVRHIPLPDLTHDAVIEHDARLREAQPGAARRDLRPEGRADAEQTIMSVLAWLWDTVAEPVLTSLGYRAAPGDGATKGASDGAMWPRIWWCPVGAVAALPLHAAGHHDDPADHPGGRRTVFDRVVSSYTPTLLALHTATTDRADAALAGEPSDTPAVPALIIAVPDAPEAPLPGVEREVAALRSLLPDIRVLSNPTRAQVLDALPRHRIAHFACHGQADRERPGQSRLILADHATEPLTIADLVGLEFDADLAYLSACNTGVTAPQLADEALHLTGAFHLAGYRQVIGTLWPVHDHTAADLAADIYGRLANGADRSLEATRAAEAVHHAVRALRDEHPTSPSIWAPYTHTGA